MHREIRFIWTYEPRVKIVRDFISRFLRLELQRESDLLIPGESFVVGGFEPLIIGSMRKNLTTHLQHSVYDLMSMIWFPFPSLPIVFWLQTTKDSNPYTGAMSTCTSALTLPHRTVEICQAEMPKYSAI